MQAVPSLVAGVLLGSLAAVTHAQDQSPPQALATLRGVRVTGAKEIPEAEVIGTARVRVGEPLPDSPDRIAQTVEHRYGDEGYTFATVKGWATRSVSSGRS